MSRILVTGGRGALGSALVSKLTSNPSYHVRVMSRRPKPIDLMSDVEWAQADLESDAGLSEAVAQVQTIIHAATRPFWHSRQIDVEGTRRLLDEGRAAQITHLIYISIVGVDRIPYSYYQNKLAAEEIIANGNIPWSILRATQFHYLLDVALQAMTKLPIAPWFTDMPCQPVATDDVADALCRIVAAGPSGRVPDMGGPEVLGGNEIARTWLDVRGMHRVIVPLHLPGKAANGFRRGYHTCPENRLGRVTWREWVERKYARPSTSQAQSPGSAYGGG
jgi:uncharacterized protein YbjT (DUF2867 family)